MNKIQTASLNSKVGAVMLLIGSIMVFILSYGEVALSPLRMLTVFFMAFGSWALCDELGMKGPLNRAGFVAFVIAMSSKIQIIINYNSPVLERLLLLYSLFLLLAVFFWSVSLLHRKKSLKLVGGIGAIATILPLFMVVIGHVFVGFGVAVGIETFLSFESGGDLNFVSFSERFFAIWGVVVSILLWKGKIKDHY